MNNRTILMILVIFLIAVTINWLLESNEENQQPIVSARDEPDLYMINASIKQFDSSGNLQQVITADEFTHYSLSQITSLILPTIKLFADDAAHPWTIVSISGKIIPEKGMDPETLELWGNVSASKTYADGDYVTIETDRLRVIPNKDFVETESTVLIRNSVGSTQAGGMTALLAKKHYEFYSTKNNRVSSIFSTSTTLNGEEQRQ